MFGLSPWELMIVLLLILLLFGAKRLPELARSLGRSIKEFKRATQDLQEELDLNKIDQPKQPPMQQHTAANPAQSTTPPPTGSSEQKSDS